MHKKNMEGSVVWKLLCWLTLAGAVHQFAIGNVAWAIAIASLSVLLFVIDFKAALTESKSGKESAFDFVKRDRVGQVLIALAILVGVQIVLKLLYERTPDIEPPAICLMCNR